jgi:hypothetical protein
MSQVNNYPLPIET